MAIQDSSTLQELKTRFPAESWSWLIPALHRDPLVWKKLSQQDYLALAADELGDDPAGWTPARLGVLAVNQEHTPGIPWPVAGYHELSPELRQLVYQYYQELDQDEAVELDLGKACLISFALLGENGSGKPWVEILPRLSQQAPTATIFSCAWDLTSHAADFLRALPPRLGTEILLSQPLKGSDMRSVLVQTLSDLEVENQILWLERLRIEKPNLAAQAAGELVSHHDHHPVSLEEKLLEVELFLLAGQQQQAREMISQAQTIHGRIQDRLVTRSTALNLADREPQLTSASWQELKKTAGTPSAFRENAEHIAGLIHALLEREYFSAVSNLLEILPEPYPNHPALLTALAAAAYQLERPDQARELALQALNQTSKHAPAPAAMGKLLLKLGLEEEAQSASESALKAAPFDIEALTTLAESLDRQGSPTRAADYLQLAVVKEPHSLDLHRKLAGALEKSGRWEEALQERGVVLSEHKERAGKKGLAGSPPPLEDLHALAACAYQAEQPERAAEACRTILDERPDDALAHATLGKSLAQLGEEARGLDHLNRAADIAPELEDAWLALAEYELKAENQSAAVEILKRGTNASAKLARIYHRLGEIYRDQNAHAEALKSFQKSAQLMDKEQLDTQSEFEIQYQLGEAYHHLGHLDKARNTIQELQARFPENVQGNALYGQILLDLDDPRSALPYLAKVVDQQPEHVQPYLHYADAHLQIGANPKYAARALDQALNIEPENQIALALKGEAQAASGNFSGALETFRKALDSELSAHPGWGPRIILGFGKASLEAGEVETAVATLKDGCQNNPEHLALRQGLAEAYLEADLTSRALEEARTAFRTAPDQVGSLTWTADFMLQAGSPADAEPALEKLIELEPENITAYLKLGQAHRLQGQPEKAAGALARIISLDQAQPADLYQAGDQLLKLGDLQHGMQALKKAANICQANPALEDQLPEIWSRLAVGYELNGDPTHALELLDKAIAAELSEPEWRVQKADLLIRLHRYQAALASLNNALQLAPDHPAYHHKLAVVHRQVTGYETALVHAQAAVKGYRFQEDRQPDDYHAALNLAAQLAAASLQPDLAADLLQVYRSSIEENPGNEDSMPLECLQAELALDSDQEVEAAEIINELVDKDPHHPRVLALQARMLGRQHNLEDAERALHKASVSHQKGKGSQPLFPTALPLSIGKAARELQNYTLAGECFEETARTAPLAPIGHLELARTLVEQAEFMELAGALKSIRFNTEAALAEQRIALLHEALSALDDLGVDPRLITKWEVRGEAVFSPGPESARGLDEIAVDLDEIAALIAVYRTTRRIDLAAKTAREQEEHLGENTTLDAQIALVCLKTDPDLAQQAAGSALGGCSTEYPNAVPLFQVLSGMAALRAGEKDEAYLSVSSALESWKDEPRWHNLAATAAPEPARAVSHLEQALELEPEYPGHYLTLGKVYLQHNQAQSAVNILEEGLSLTPEHTEIWLTLAGAYRMIGNLEQAYSCAERAAELAPEHLGAQKTAASLAYQQGNYRGAEKHLSVLIDLAPQDPEALSLLSQTLAAEGEPQEALTVLDKAISLEDRSLDLELQRAGLVKELEGPYAAVDALRVIHSQHAADYQVILSLVRALVEAGETDQAVSAAQEALHQEDLGHTREQKAELHLMTGRLLRNSGHLDQAVHHLHQALKLTGEQAQAHLELGCLHHDRRQYDQALEHLMKAIELDSQDPNAYYHAGRVLKDLKEFSRAENMLRRASKLAPNDLRIHRQLGVLVTLNLVHGDPKPEPAA